MMNWSSLAGAVAWPLTALVIFFTLRLQAMALLDALRVKLGQAEKSVDRQGWSDAHQHHRASECSRRFTVPSRCRTHRPQRRRTAEGPYRRSGSRVRAARRRLWQLQHTRPRGKDQDPSTLGGPPRRTRALAKAQSQGSGSERCGGTHRRLGDRGHSEPAGERPCDPRRRSPACRLQFHPLSDRSRLASRSDDRTRWECDRPRIVCSHPRGSSTEHGQRFAQSDRGNPQGDPTMMIMGWQCRRPFPPRSLSSRTSPRHRPRDSWSRR